MEDKSDGRMGNLAKVFTIDMDNPVSCDEASSSEGDEEQSSANAIASSSYTHLKSFGLLSAYRNSTVPVKVGGLKLADVHGKSFEKRSLDDSRSVGKAAWTAKPTLPSEDFISRKPGSEGSSSIGVVNHAKLSALVRKRQLRRLKRYGGHRGNFTCLRLTLSILYYLGVSPYRPRLARKLPKSLAQLLKVVHWIVITIAILESISYLKLCWIEFRVVPKIQSIAEIGIAMISMIARIYTMKVFAAMKKRMDRLLHLTFEDDVENLDRGLRSTVKPSVAVYVGTAISLSIGLALCSVIFGYHSLNNWSFEGQQRIVAFDTSKFVTSWTASDWKNATDQLYDQYMAISFSTKSVILAIIGDIAVFIGQLYDNLTVDFWLALSYQVHLIQLDLNKHETGTKDSNNTAEFDSAWGIYMDCRLECDRIEEIFGHLMKLVHLTNILRMSDFLLDLMEMDMSAQRVACCINLMKICAGYYFCMLCSNTNTMMHEQVVNQSDSNGFVEIDGVKMKIYSLRMEMDQHPIGLGRGNFFVEESLLIKMLCAAWSVFALFADHSQGQR